MKKIYLQLFLSCFALLTIPLYSSGGVSAGWSQKYEPQKVFIENKGQFNTNQGSGFDSKVVYAFDGEGQRFYMTRSGVVFELTDIEKPKETKSKEHEDRELKERMDKGISAEEYEKIEREERRVTVTRDELRAQWIGANPDVEIIADDKIDPYFSYSFKNEKGEDVNENFIAGYKKLTYKNLYHDIDVVYEVHPQGGIKYSVIVYPGGDISQVKLQYSKKARLMADGDIKTKSVFGDFIDHAPVTFYQEDKTPIKSSYTLKNNAISFSVGDHDPSKVIVIDPWTQNPAFAGSGGWPCVWECQKDAAGNVYVIGGVTPLKLIKYNSAGTLQWSYSTPYDTVSSWLGTFAVDNPGNSYVTNGTPEAIIKISTAGGVVWNNANPPGLTLLAEFWSISFNCDQTQMVIGGTGGTLNPTPYIYNVDVATGTVTNSLAVTGAGSLIGFPPMTQEVRAICACGNGNYYFLTHDSIGYIHQGLTSCLPPGSSYPFHVASGYDMGYKCEDWRANNTGIKAIKSFGGYVYTARGSQVDKRLFSTGGIIGTATIPGGAYPITLGQGQVSNSGIDIDSCGNVYVGSANEVIKYDQNLNQLATFSTSSNFYVYDVQVAPGGVVVAAGSNGNDNSSGARAGYVETFAGGACPAIAIVCCDATICPHANACTTDAPFNLTSTTSGGVWSGTGITNSTNGTFSPGVAGVGTFTIYYTLACGRDSTTITVENCSALTVCRNANGSVTVSGGSAPYSWAVWDSTGQTCNGIVIFGICTGTEVTDYGWTTVTTGTTFTPPSQADTIKVSNAGAADSIYNISALPLCVTCNLVVSPGAQTNVNCFGGTTGIAHVTVSGGTSPYTYTWSPNVSTVDSATHLAAGTYTVTVHDASGCSGTASFTITQPAAAVSATTVATPASCGNDNGKIVVTPSGGTPGYAYIWSPNVSTADSAVNLAANTYNITVTDSKGCTFATSASVTSVSGITVSPGTQTNVNCFGGTTGIAHVTVSGGTSPYTYTWSPNVSTVDSATHLAAGTYTVTVHDANGCSGTASFTITQPAAAVSATTVATPASCGNNNGKIVVTPSGGTPGYTYIWSPNVSTVDSAVSLAVNTYNITVTDSKGCTFATSASVISSSGLTVSPGAQTNVNCFGGTTGIAHVTVTGGTSPYTYTWSPNVSTVDSATHLAAGTYTVTVHDAGGCSGTTTFTITAPATALGATTVVKATSCGNNNGKIVITPSGGTPGYTYLWSPNVSTIDSAVNLAANTYDITITDTRGCTVTASGNVSSSTDITVTPGVQTNILCFGANTGAAHVIVSGGTLPYIYIWSPNVSTVDSATHLSAGIYTVTVHDAGGCSGTTTFTITQPATAVSARDTTVSAFCGNNDGKVYVTPSGGTPGYSYTWSPNVSTNDSAINLGTGSYSITVRDANNCTVGITAIVSSANGVTASPGPQTNVNCFGGATGVAHVTASGGTLPYTYTWSPNVSTVDSASNLAAGNYTVTVQDASGCQSLVTFTITQPASALSATDTTLPAYCGNNTGKVYITPSGGTPGYNYAWSPNISTNDSAVHLAAGSYLVTITDTKGCTVMLTATVQPATGTAISLVSKQDVTCNGGSNGNIYVTATGGVGPYTYTWSPSVSTVDSAVNLAQGAYTVTVHDANNCTSSISISINQPAAINITTTTTQANCGVSNGTAIAIVGNGTAPIVYQWSAGTATDSLDTGLPAGSYTVTVTDVNHCTGVGTAAISNVGAPTATIAGIVNISCSGGNNGKIILNINGGTQPYTYTWSPNVSTVDSGVNLTAGTYVVTVQDASNCIAVVDTTITQPQALAATVQSGNTNCGQSNGWAKINVAGGTGSYTYAWSVAQATDSITGLSGSTYYVTVTDSLGCTLTDSVVVGTNAGPPAPAISANGPLIFCQGGSVTLISSAPTGNIWSNGATSQSITVSTSGIYTVTQTVNGCTSPASASVTVTVNPIPPAPAITASGPLSFCPGGSVTLTSSAPSGNLWSDNETTQSIVVNTAGTYTVSDTVAGCPSPASAPVTVSIVSSPLIAINASQLSLCPGVDSIVLDATTISATAYVWSTGATQPSVSINSPGVYRVSVTVNGCLGTDSIAITSQPLLGTLTLPDSFSICPGDSVTLDATTANAISYVWSGPTNAVGPVIVVDSEGVYEVKVSNNCGSTGGTTIVSFKDCECRIVMPNAFTPNGDGINDFFGPDYECANATSLLMRIYDRWGEKVFETHDLNGQWDGKYKGALQTPGVYVYYVEFVGEENNTVRNFKLMGSLTLIR